MSIARLHPVTLHSVRSTAAVLLLAASLSLTVATPGLASALSLSSVRQCDNAAIISCGALSTDEIVSRYDASPYVQKVYSYFGITKADIQQLAVTAQAGSVDKNGNVYLGDESTPVVAKAMTAEAQNSSGAISVTSDGATFYKQPLSAVVSSSSQAAFVVMSSGAFRFAIISSNGNPVVAPAKPAPVATPAPAEPAPAIVEPSTPTVATPGTLANTGSNMGTLLELFVLASVLGALASRRYQLRR